MTAQPWARPRDSWDSQGGEKHVGSTYASAPSASASLPEEPSPPESPNEESPPLVSGVPLSSVVLLSSPPQEAAKAALERAAVTAIRRAMVGCFMAGSL